MSTFLDEVAALSTVRPSSICSVKTWLEANPDVTDKELKQAREQNTLKAVWLVMRQRGYASRPETLSKHLRGECKCPSSTK